MNIKNESEYKYSVIKLIEGIRNNLQSKELIIDYDLSPSPCLLLLYQMFKMVLSGRNSITKIKIIHNAKVQISFDKTIIINSSLKGRSNVTPTYTRLIVAEKGEGVY